MGSGASSLYHNVAPTVNRNLEFLIEKGVYVKLIENRHG